MSQTILHADFISLAKDVTREARRDLLTRAADLVTINGVIAGASVDGDAGSDFDIALLFTVESLQALEHFGTDARYLRFLRGDAAPALRALAGADVRLESSLPPPGPYAACLAVATAEETYDWQVKDALQAWADGVAGATTAVGLASTERQRFRGLAFCAAAGPVSRPVDLPAGFAVTFVGGRARRLR